MFDGPQALSRMLTGQAEGNDESSPAVLARVKYWIEFFVNTIKEDGDIPFAPKAMYVY